MLEAAKEKLLRVPKSNPYHAEAHQYIETISAELEKKYAQESTRAAETQATAEAGTDTGGAVKAEKTGEDEIETACLEIEKLLTSNQLKRAHQTFKELKEKYPESDEAAEFQNIFQDQIQKEMEYHLGSDDEILMFTPIFNIDEAQYYNLTPEEAYVISRIDGSNDIKTLVQMSGLPTLEAYLILLEIYKSGLITSKSREDAKKYAASKKTDEVKEPEKEPVTARAEPEPEKEVVEDEVEVEVEDEEEEEDEEDEEKEGDVKGRPKSMLERIGRIKRKKTRKKRKKKKSVSEKDRIMRVLKFQQFIKDKDPFVILRVSKDADQQELKSAYRKLVAEFHPDLYQSEVYEGIHKNINEIFEKISDAYERLSGMAPPPGMVKEEVKKKAAAEDKMSLSDRKVIAHRHYQDGMQAFNKRDFATAINHFEQAIAKYSNNPVYFSMLNDARSQARSGSAFTVFNEGLKMYERGDANTALRHIKNAIKMDSNNPSFYAKAGEILFKNQQNYGEAGKYILKALEMNPDNSEYYILHARILKSQKKFNEARQQYKLALKWDPKNKVAKKEMESLP
jgi:tetratricopeptide (TPR) repeat protein